MTSASECSQALTLSTQSSIFSSYFYEKYIFSPLEYIPSSLHPSFRFCLGLLVLLIQFSLGYLLHLRSGILVLPFLSPLPHLPAFDTFLDTLLHIWSQSSSLICLWLVFLSLALVLPLCAIALPVTCCLYFSFMPRDPFLLFLLCCE